MLLQADNACATCQLTAWRPHTACRAAVPATLHHPGSPLHMLLLLWKGLQKAAPSCWTLDVP